MEDTNNRLEFEERLRNDGINVVRGSLSAATEVVRQEESTSKDNTPTIAGGIAAGVAVMVLVALVVFWKKRSSPTQVVVHAVPADNQQGPDNPTIGIPAADIIVPLPTTPYKDSVTESTSYRSLDFKQQGYTHDGERSIAVQPNPEQTA